MIVHGNKDDLVPLDQCERMIGKLKVAGVNAEFVVSYSDWLREVGYFLNRLNQPWENYSEAVDTGRPR